MIIAWIIGFILHELFHYIVGKCEGADVYIKIWFWHKIPSMKCAIRSGSVSPLFYLAGGLGTCILFTLIGVFLLEGFCQYSILLVACINGVYSIFETLYHDLPIDTYMKRHYLLYTYTGITFTIIYGCYICVIGV